MGHGPHPDPSQILGLHLNSSSLGRVFPEIPVTAMSQIVSSFLGFNYVV